MSGTSNPNIGASKRQSSPLGDAVEDDSIPPEKRHAGSSGDEILSESVQLRDDSQAFILNDDLSKWQAFGQGNVLDKLQLIKHNVTVQDNDLTAFITDTPGEFQFLPLKPEEQCQLNTYFTMLNKYIDFDVMDEEVEIGGVVYQYGGYDRKFGRATKTPAEIHQVFSDLEACFLEIEKNMRTAMVHAGLADLIDYCVYAKDFIGEATQMLFMPTECQQPVFKDLFNVFSRLAGLHLKNAAREAPRHCKIFGTKISGKCDMRAYVPLDKKSWWRHKPVSSDTMPLSQTLRAVVEVRLAPTVKSDSVELQTERYLGQVVGEMLAELLSTHPHVLVASSERTHMLGILVLSTKVYFIKLYVPPSLMDLYRIPASMCQDEDIEKGKVVNMIPADALARMSTGHLQVYFIKLYVPPSLMDLYRIPANMCQDQDIEKGKVYVTQGFDFMKRTSRLQVLKILHKIGTIVP